MSYNFITCQEDIDFFLQKTAALNDGDILSVNYEDKGLRKTCMGYHFKPGKSELRIRVLVSSNIVELVFSGLLHWKIADDGFELIKISLYMDQNGFLTLRDESDPDDMALHVVAEKMCWRIE